MNPFSWKGIYLDNNATTRLDPKVLAVVKDDLQEHFGNPSSAHFLGQDSRSRITKARDIIASYLKVKSNEITFTSNGTEALNMVISGFCAGKSPGHIVTSSVEHAAVNGTMKMMEQIGWKVTYLSPGAWGAVTPEALQEALQPETRLIVLMAANNETGVKTDITSIAAIAEEKNIPFLVDGVAILGKENFSIPSGVSAMCFSGHKLHAPKGIGCAFVRGNLKLRPLLAGGEQEYGRRGGTENVTGIVGFGEAVQLLSTVLPESTMQMQRLRDKLEEEILKVLPNVIVNGQGPRIANTSNLCFSGISGEDLLHALDREGIAVSHGSACSSGAREPSRILLNMGIPVEKARSSLRFSLSRFTTEEEIDNCVETILRVASL